MKKLMLIAAFAGLLGSSAFAGTKGDDKSKKDKKECKAGDKACAGEKKESCANGEKSCCKKKEASAATPAENKTAAVKK